MKYIVVIFAFVMSSCVCALPVGDTKGNVKAVRVVHSAVNGGKSSFQIYFENATRDRFGCIADDGYVLVREDGIAVTMESFKMMFAIALAAQTSGKVLAVDSSSDNPCINVNIAWMEN